MTLMLKSKLTHFVATLSNEKKQALDKALAYALQLNG